MLAIGAGLALGVAAFRGWTALRLRALRAEPGAEHWEVLRERPDGRPAILVFSTPSCAECKVQDRVLGDMPGVRVLRVDAHERPDVAARFGVLTVPATVVLRPDGTVAAMNHRLADAARLRAQLRAPAPGGRAVTG